MSKANLKKSAIIPIDAATSVGIRDLRDHLSAHLERVKAGETLTVTEHGRPIARIVSQALPPYLLELISRGTVTPASRPMPDLRKIRRHRITGSTQDLIDEIRD